jgi:hypothetical protein
MTENRQSENLFFPRKLKNKLPQILKFMKTKITTILLFITVYGFSQNRILFRYDESGNQKRRYVGESILGRFSQTPEPKIEESKFIEDKNAESFNFYPNPTEKTVQLKWKNIDDLIVYKIELYNPNGQFLKSLDNLEKLSTSEIDLQAYNAGLYQLVVCYSNGTRKTFKIIKK